MHSLITVCILMNKRRHLLSRRKHRLNWRRRWKTMRDGVIRIKRFDELVGWPIDLIRKLIWCIYEFVVSSVTCNPYNLIMHIVCTILTHSRSCTFLLEVMFCCNAIGFVRVRQSSTFPCFFRLLK